MCRTIECRSRVVVLDSEQYALEQCVNCGTIFKICHSKPSLRRTTRPPIGLFGLILITAFSAFSGGYVAGIHAESAILRVIAAALSNYSLSAGNDKTRDETLDV